MLGVFGYFGGTEKGTWGALIKILIPLFNTNIRIFEKDFKAKTTLYCGSTADIMIEIVQIL